MLCAPITKVEIEELFADDIIEEDEVRIEKDGALKARRVRRYGSVELDVKQTILRIRKRSPAP